MIKNAIEIGNYKEASDLQLIAKKKMDEIQQLYINYRKNIF